MKKYLLIALVTLLAILGIHTSMATNVASTNSVSGEITILEPKGEPIRGKGWDLTATSGASEIALAKHLRQTGATLYGAYWCPLCYQQLQLFGKEAATTKLLKVECAEDAKNAQVAKCDKAGITGLPTWIIKGKYYPGIQTLEKLAQLTQYQGSQNFKLGSRQYK
jgi:hypothetical protein